MNPVSFYSAACVSLSLASFWLVSSVAFNRIFRQPAGSFGRGVYRWGRVEGGTVLRFCILRVGLSGLLADFKLGFHGN